MMKIKSVLLVALMLVSVHVVAKNDKESQASDREVWTELCYKIAQPILENMSKGELQKNMNLELSPTWDGRDKRVAYMEAFGRLMAGISPWLALPDDESKEGRMRKQLRDWAILSYKNAVNPDSPDCLLWEGPTQILVDAAYIAESFIRGYNSLWMPLDEVTKERYINQFVALRRINPLYTNWLLFSSTIETFLHKVGAKADYYRIDSALRKISEWYIGDGWYSDGPSFAFDYYNSFVIHPMFFELKFCVFMPGYIKTQSFVRQTCDKHHALTSCTLLHSQGLKGRVFLRAGVSWNTYNYFSNLRRQKKNVY